MKSKITLASIILLLITIGVCHSLLDLEKLTVIILNLVLSSIAISIVYFKDIINERLLNAEKKLDDSHFIINSNFAQINSKIDNINSALDDFTRRSLVENILHLLKSNIDIVRSTVFFIFKLESTSLASNVFNILKLVTKFSK